MAQFDRRVTPASSAPPSLLPDAFAAFGVMVTFLRETGLLEVIRQRLRLPRKSGFQGLDLFVFLLALFASRMDGKVRKFADRWAGPRGALVAAVAGQRCFPSQASVSRALESTTLEVAHDFAALVLRESSLLMELLHHSAVQHADCLGDRWHVFDMDPTATGVRWRALPEGEDLPEANRQSGQIAQPGYLGRKRGNAKVSRPTLMHRGARVYLDASIAAGNSEWASAVQSGLDAVEDVARRCEIPIERCVCVTDGESGGNVQTRLGLASGVHFVTRLAEYTPLQRPEVLEALRQQARWERVEGGLSGPARWATEFGEKRYNTGQARLVISRFENHSGVRRGAGKLVESEQFEVYATDLPADAFPAPNSSTFITREEVSKTIWRSRMKTSGSTHLQLQSGWAVAGHDHCALPTQPSDRARHADSRRTAVSLPQQPRQVEAVGEGPWLVDEHEQPFGSASDELVEELNADTTTSRINTLRQAIEKRSDLSFDGKHVLCLAGHELRFNREYREKDGTVLLRLRVRSGVCVGCPMRASCTSSTNESYQKELDVRLPEGADTMIVVDPWSPPRRVLPQGPAAMRAPVLCPQKLRHVFRDLAQQTRIYVTTVAVPRPLDGTYGGLYALNAAQRQHRRPTWTERSRWNSLSEHQPVTVEFIAGTRLRRVLPEVQPAALCEAQR